MKINTYGHTLPHIFNMHIILAINSVRDVKISLPFDSPCLALSCTIFLLFKKVTSFTHSTSSCPKCVCTYILFYEYLNNIYKLIFFIHNFSCNFFMYSIIISNTLALSFFFFQHSLTTSIHFLFYLYFINVKTVLLKMTKYLKLVLNPLFSKERTRLS